MGELASGETSYTIGLRDDNGASSLLLNRFCTFETKTGPSVRTPSFARNSPKPSETDMAIIRTFCIFATVFLALSTGVCDATNVKASMTRYVDKKINDLRNILNMYVRVLGRRQVRPNAGIKTETRQNRVAVANRQKDV